jgi:hypothetical protein
MKMRFSIRDLLWATVVVAMGLLGSLISVTTAKPGRAADPPRTRHEFAKVIGEVKWRMSPAEVLALLGRPDDIRTERDDGVSTVGTKEIWRYGTSGHLTTATLGQVYFDEKDRVQHVFGQGTPPPEGMFEERDLRVVLDALGQVPSYNAAWRYNPRKLIRAVNLLQPLGKVKALAVIDEYLRVTSDWHDDGREGLFLVLRTLFDVPDDPGHMPVMGVGAPSPSEPKDQKLLPRFPIAIEGDIPLLLVEGYMLAGSPEQVESHVAYFRQNGRVRAKPLVPTDNPFKELEKFAKSPRWIYDGKDGLHDEQRGRQFLGEQLLRLMDTVYRVEVGDFGEILRFDDNEETRGKKVVEGALNLTIRWDSKIHKYTFLDGKSLPEREPKNYRRERWRPKIAGLDIEVFIRRAGPRYVSIWVSETYQVGKGGPGAVIKVVDVKAKDKPLVKIEAGRGAISELPLEGRKGTTAASSTWKPFELKEGGEVQIQLVVAGKSHFSPTFKP